MLQRLDDQLFMGRELRKELSLNACLLGSMQLAVVLPPHGTDEVVGRSDELRPIIAYQVVASLRINVADAARKGKHVAMVLTRQTGGDQSSAMLGRLHQHTGIRHASHDAVAPHEVHLVGIGSCHVLGEQSTLRKHFHGCFTVARRIQLVESVGQHAHCREAVVQRLTVRLDINTISREGLLLIPNVGEVTADEIIALRGRLGRISDMSRLLEISGIGEARLAALSEYLYVSGGGNSTLYEPPQTNEQAVTQPDASSEEQSSPTAESGSSGEETDSVTDESSGSDDGGMVYINSADAEELAEKLGISPGKAEDIIDVRMRIGGFSAIEELMLVDSLTTNDIAEIKDRIIID